MSRRATDPDQLVLDLLDEVTDEEAEAALEPGGVFAIRNRFGLGHSRYRLDWTHCSPPNHWHPPSRSVWTASLTLLGGMGGALVSPTELVASEWEGKSTWSMKHPRPHLGKTCGWDQEQKDAADRFEATGKLTA